MPLMRYNSFHQEYSSNHFTMTWYKRKVQMGAQQGRKIGFPTLNFMVGDFARNHAAGVYGCELTIHNEHYKGALYFGPRLGTGEMVLELYVLDFNQMVYGETVRFRVLGKVRNALSFKNLTEIKGQIRKDLEMIGV